MTESPTSIETGAASATRASIGWKLLLGTIARLPQGALSRAMGHLADTPIPRPLRPAVLGGFARATGIDLAEADRPLAEYRSLDEFFVRRLRQGVRSWPADPATLGSPVDGVIGELGTVCDGRLLQAKGRDYSVAALLDDATQAARFDGGAFLTLYLSPRHYHRIHSPAAGSIRQVRHVPGALLPVNRPAVEQIPELFPRNERVVCYLDAQPGRIAVVAVGAYNVGRIEVLFGGGWRTNRAGAAVTDHVIEPPHAVGRGDEILVFHLGSTVVLLFERDRVRLDTALVSGASIQLGQPIGSPGR